MIVNWVALNTIFVVVCHLVSGTQSSARHHTWPARDVGRSAAVRFPVRWVRHISGHVQQLGHGGRAGTQKKGYPSRVSYRPRVSSYFAFDKAKYDPVKEKGGRYFALQLWHGDAGCTVLLAAVCWCNSSRAHFDCAVGEQELNPNPYAAILACTSGQVSCLHLPASTRDRPLCVVAVDLCLQPGDHCCHDGLCLASQGKIEDSSLFSSQQAKRAACGVTQLHVVTAVCAQY